MNILHNTEAPLIGQYNKTRHEAFLLNLFRANVLTSSGKTYAYVVDLTPEGAEALDNLNYDNNRSVFEKNVLRFCKAIGTDFFMNGTPIRLAYYNGHYTLTDGQHRLEAIARSGQTTTVTIIVTEIDPSIDYAAADQIAKARVDADAVKAIGQDKSMNLSGTMRATFLSALKVIKANFPLGAVDKYDPYELSEMETLYGKEFQFLRSFFGNGTFVHTTTRGVYKTRVLAVALVTAKYVQPDRVKEFWEQVVLDDGLRQSDPRKVLHGHLSARSGDGERGRVSDQIAAATCWNYFVEGKTLSKLYTDKKMPKIALTPYPLTK